MQICATFKRASHSTSIKETCRTWNSFSSLSFMQFMSWKKNLQQQIQKLITLFNSSWLWPGLPGKVKMLSLRLWTDIKFYQFNLFFKMALRSILTITYRLVPFSIHFPWNIILSWRCSRKYIQHKKQQQHIGTL